MNLFSPIIYQTLHRKTLHTSTTHSLVFQRKHRRGETLHLPCCGKNDHADLHASKDIAGYLFLQPGLPVPEQRRVVREKHADVTGG
jgi:transposase